MVIGRMDGVNYVRGLEQEDGCLRTKWGERGIPEVHSVLRTPYLLCQPGEKGPRSDPFRYRTVNTVLTDSVRPYHTESST